MTISIKQLDNKVELSLEKKTKLIPAAFKEFLDKETRHFNDAVRQKVFGQHKASVESKGKKKLKKSAAKYLPYRTGATMRLGFILAKRHKDVYTKSTRFTAHFWAPIANIYENWKDATRQKIRITQQARKAFEKDAVFQADVQQLTRKVVD